jgi:hypothetical protein
MNIPVSTSHNTTKTNTINESSTFKLPTTRNRNSKSLLLPLNNDIDNSEIHKNNITISTVTDDHSKQNDNQVNIDKHHDHHHYQYNVHIDNHIDCRYDGNDDNHSTYDDTNKNDYK